eukprot:scaffold143696_cov35-Tisochrysis_lutea.AAC.1
MHLHLEVTLQLLKALVLSRNALILLLLVLRTLVDGEPASAADHQEAHRRASLLRVHRFCGRSRGDSSMNWLGGAHAERGGGNESRAGETLHDAGVADGAYGPGESLNRAAEKR